MGKRRPGGTPRGSSTAAAAAENASGSRAIPALAARSSPQLRASRRWPLPGPSDVSASHALSRDSDSNGNWNASSSSKKRKRISARSYFQRFKMAQGANAAAADPVVATLSPHLHQAETGPMFSVASTTTTTTLSPPRQQLNVTQQKQGVKKLINTPENLHTQLKQQLSKLIKVLRLPDNVSFMANKLFEFVLNNHQVVTEPVGILHAFNIALCWRAASLLNCKVDRRESLALAEKSLNCEFSEDIVAVMYRKLRTLKDKISYRGGETSMEGQPVASQEISTVAEQMILERKGPVQETRRECHVQNDELHSMIVEKCIDLVGHVFSLREKNILCKQQLEISGLVTHRQINVIRLREVCSLVLEHIRRSHIDEMTRREKIKLTAQWFSMLMYAFLEHMKLQHEKLEGLQSDRWSSERQLKETLRQVAKSGQLDQDFDQHIALPDSNFVMEEFIHFKEQNDEYRIVESSMSYCQLSMQDELSETEDEPDAVDEPSEAEDEPVEAASLGAIAAEALQPEIQSSTSTQDVLVERTYLSGMHVLQSPTIQQSVEPSLDPHAGAEPVGMVTAHYLQSDILPSAPVPAKQNTSLLAQQSLATSQHSPAEAEPADILGIEPACDLQPSLGEVCDEPAEEQSCILGAIAAQNLQPETQPSTSKQSAPFDRTNRSAAPSLDPDARAESTHTLGSLTAHALQPEVQPSASIQDQPAEAEAAVTLGSRAAQDLQAQLQSSTTVEQTNIIPGVEQPTQRPQVAMLVSNNPVLSDDCLKNELHTLMHCKSLLSKDHRHKKALLLIECKQEIEKVIKKYAWLLQKEDSAYLETRRDVDDIYRKVVAHTSLAENFRREMIPSGAARGEWTSPVMEQPSESCSAAASPVTSSSAVRPRARNLPGPHVRPSFVAQPSWSARRQAILHANFYGTTSSPPLGPAPAPHNSGGGSQGAPLPASARLVQEARMPCAVHTEQHRQQKLPAATPRVASLGQYAAPVMTGSYASSSLGSTAGAAPRSPPARCSQSPASLNSVCLPARFGLGRIAAASAQVVCLSDDESEP